MCGVSTINTDKNKMKKIILLLSAAAFIMLISCNKEKEKDEPTLDNKVLINEIFQAGMSGYSQGMALKSTVPINYNVEYYQYGVEGGTIHVLGSVTGSITVDDNTGALITGIVQIGLTEAINDYTFKSNGGTYMMNGAPYISLAGTFTLQPGGTFGTASSMSIGGGVRVTGPGVDQTINMQITIIINSNGTGGHVSGFVGATQLDYTF
jgi:hypothetical protein